jgi:hypothetical protein
MIVEILKITHELQRNSEEQRQLLIKPPTPIIESGVSGYGPTWSFDRKVEEILSSLENRGKEKPSFQREIKEIISELEKRSKEKTSEESSEKSA